ncbi:MAG TPA: hypothetical protein VGL93_10550 [Streptosporangiaceae bacterium]
MTADSPRDLDDDEVYDDDPYEDDADDQEDEGDAYDFDAWRASEAARRAAEDRPRTVRLFGRSVPVPTSVPLGVAMHGGKSADDDKAVRASVAALYGADALTHWAENGATLDDLQVLLAWGMAVAAGREVSFERAVELLAEAKEKEAAGKARARPKTRRRGR